MLYFDEHYSTVIISEKLNKFLKKKLLLLIKHFSIQYSSSICYTRTLQTNVTKMIKSKSIKAICIEISLAKWTLFLLKRE